MEQNMEKPKQEEKGEIKQIIEGVIGEMDDNWPKILPPHIKKEEVDLFIGKDKQWHWHLKPEYIEDEEQREKYKEDKNCW